MDDIYREDVLDHYKHPRNYGKVAAADVVVEEKNSSCGDEIKLSLKLKTQNLKPKTLAGDQKSEIEEIKFEGQGCAVSMAFASMLIEKIKEEGWGVEEIEKMSEEELLGLVGGDKVSAARQKCVRLGVKAVKEAVRRVDD